MTSVSDKPSAVSTRAVDDCAKRSLTSHTLGGLKWTYLATMVGAIAQIGITAVMSRLLTPAEYGVVAAAGFFTRFASYFSEMGVGQALVQKSSLSKDDVRAAFTASSGSSMLMALALFFCAPLSLHVLSSPHIVLFVRLLAINMALAGFASTSLNLLRRELRFRAISTIEVASYALSYAVVGIPLALAGAGVWALAGALLTQALLTLCLARHFQKHSINPCFRWSVHKSLLSFGTSISLTSFMEFLFFQAEIAVVGRFFGDAVLGMYSRASLLSNLFIQNATGAMMKVLFPAFSRAQADTLRLRSAYLQGMTLLGMVSIPLAAGMIPAAKDLTLALLGSQYRDASTLVQIIVMAVPPGMIAWLNATICNVTGRVLTRLFQQIVLCPIMWLAVCLAAPFGLQSIAAASLIVQTLRMVGFQSLAQKSLGIGWKEFGSALRPGLQLAAMVAGSVWLVAHGLPRIPHLFRLILEIGAASGVCIFWSVWCVPRRLVPLVLNVLDFNALLNRSRLLAWYRVRLEAKTAAA